MTSLRIPGLLALACSTILVACGSDVRPPSASTAASRHAVAPQVVEIDEDPVAEYRYNPEGKPDPFMSFIRVTTDLETETSPLERFVLSQLVVTAIIWGAGEPRALVTDPAGRGYIVAEGASIGKNKGRIVEIEDNLVLVKETYVDFRDRATTKEVEMRLYESQGG